MTLRRKAGSWIDELLGIYVAESTGRHWIDPPLKGPYTPFASPMWNISAPFLSPSSSPPLLLSHFLLRSLQGSLLFPLPLDVISKSRSPWQQLVTSSSPTLCVWWLFLFWRVRRCARTSLADRQVTCSGDEGTMLPSVGSVCLHTVTDIEKHPAFLWWLMTGNHMPIKTFGCNQEPYGSIVFETHLSHRSPSLKRSACTTTSLPLERNRNGKQRCCFPLVSDMKCSHTQRNGGMI